MDRLDSNYILNKVFNGGEIDARVDSNVILNSVFDSTLNALKININGYTGSTIVGATGPQGPAGATGATGAAGGSGTQASNEIIINITEDEIIGKQYKTFADAQAWIVANGNPSANNYWIIKFNGNISETVTMIPYITIVGEDKASSVISEVIVAPFVGFVYASVISNCTITLLTGTSGGLTSVVNCQVMDATMSGSVGNVFINSDLYSGDYSGVSVFQYFLNVKFFGINISVFIFDGQCNLDGCTTVGSNGTFIFKEGSDLSLSDTYITCNDFVISPLYSSIHLINSVINNSSELGINSISGNGTDVIVVTSYNHGLINNSQIIVAGYNITEFNGTFNISIIDDNTFTYKSIGAIGNPESGNIRYTNKIIETGGGIIDLRNSYINESISFNVTDNNLLTTELNSMNDITVSGLGYWINKGAKFDNTVANLPNSPNNFQSAIEATNTKFGNLLAGSFTTVDGKTVTYNEYGVITGIESI